MARVSDLFRTRKRDAEIQCGSPIRGLAIGPPENTPAISGLPPALVIADTRVRRTNEKVIQSRKTI